MCYTVKYITQKKLKYARRRGDSIEEINNIEKELIQLTAHMEGQEAASGFTHPPLLVFRNIHPLHPELMHWGLVPYWVKDRKRAAHIQNKTLNARAETLFEKPSFKKAASLQRCIIMIDGFYDYHYINNKAYPYFFEHSDQTPMVLAGLWDRCRTNDGKIWSTVTIVTTKAQGLVKEMQNKAEKNEPRSPLILSKQEEILWLSNSPQKQIEYLINNYSPTKLIVSGAPTESPGLWG